MTQAVSKSGALEPCVVLSFLSMGFRNTDVNDNKKNNKTQGHHLKK